MKLFNIRQLPWLGLPYAIPLALILSLGVPAQAQQGGSGKSKPALGSDSHGGNADELDAASAEISFKNVGLEVYEDLLNWNKAHPAEVDSEKFLETVRTSTVTATHDKLFKRDGVTPADANNLYPVQTIRFNLESWNLMNERIIKRKGIVAHEFFGLMGIELDNYRFSAPFKAFMEERGLVISDLFSGIVVDDNLLASQIPDRTRLITVIPLVIPARTGVIYLQKGQYIDRPNHDDDYCEFHFDQSADTRIIAPGYVWLFSRSEFRNTNCSEHDLNHLGPLANDESGVSAAFLRCTFISDSHGNFNSYTFTFGRLRKGTFNGAIHLEIAPPKVIR